MKYRDKAMLVLIGCAVFGCLSQKEAYTVQTPQEYAAIKASQEEEAKEGRQTVRTHMCEEMTKQSARHPSTVSFSHWNVEYVEYTNGSALLTSTASAKNSFGLEVNSNIACTFKDGKVNVKWREEG